MASISKVSTAVVQANYHWTYVRVYTDADGGLYGTGECFFAPGLAGIANELGQLLIGEDFCDVERLVERMRWASSGAGSLGGIIWNAISGIETALWDLKGKYLGIPVWQLLGGKFRDDVRIYVDCHAAGALECMSPLQQPTPPSWRVAEPPRDLSREEVIEGSAERAAGMAKLGYTAMKFDLDLPESTFDSATGYAISNKDIDWMVRLTGAIREAVGSDVDLAMDAHWRYRPNEILQVAKELEPMRLLWLEDPVPLHDEASLLYVRQHTSTPIGSGDHHQLRHGLWNLIVKNLADVIIPDVQKCGGLAEARKIADMCATATKPFAPHMIGSPIALMASAHLSLTIPNFLVCEFHAHDVPFFYELAQGGVSEWFRHGWVTPTNRPGLGIELDEEVGRRYQLPGSSWF